MLVHSMVLQNCMGHLWNDLSVLASSLNDLFLPLPRISGQLRGQTPLVVFGMAQYGQKSSFQGSACRLLDVTGETAVH